MRVGIRRVAGARGYVLLEGVLALTIFSVAILGLAQAMKKTVDAAGSFQRQAHLRMAVMAFADELGKEQDVTAMVREEVEEFTGARLVSTIDELKLVNRDGDEVEGLYRLVLVVTDPATGRQLLSLERWVRPAE
jgi:Tfp pilus assembly protein PilV